MEQMEDHLLLTVHKLSKKEHFYDFVLTSAKKLSLLKQFTYMHLKVLISLF